MNQQKKAALTDTSVEILNEFKEKFSELGYKASYASIIEESLKRMHTEYFNFNDDSSKEMEEIDEIKACVNATFKFKRDEINPHELVKIPVEVTEEKYYSKQKMSSENIFEDYKTTSLSYTSCPCADVVIASNGGKDGDWGHGGRTYLSFENKGCYDSIIKIKDTNDNTVNIGMNDLKTIEFLVGGQCETYILRDIFKEGYLVLNKAIEENNESKLH